MTSLMTSSKPIEAARGNLPEEHLFEFCAQACPALGMPRGSLTQRQLEHGQLARGDQGCIVGSLIYSIIRPHSF